MMCDFKVSASISCADLLNLDPMLKEIETSEVAFIHYDVVDGEYNDCFVLGDELLKQIKARYSIPAEVHLAVNNVEKYIVPFIKAGADAIAVHYEALEHPKKTLLRIAELGAKPILAFRAETDVPSDFEELLPYINGILKLTVNPGYPGQTIQYGALEHIKKMRERMKKKNIELPIQADGSVNKRTIQSIIMAGADVVTGGTSGLFNGKPLNENIRMLRKGCAENV